VPEPPKDRSLESLHPAMRDVVLHLLATLRAAGVPFQPDETLRTEARQAWLYAAGRTRPGPNASPKNPLGSTITQKDGAPGVWPANHPVIRERGKTRRSRHQSGLAVDLYPLDPAGHLFIPPASHPCWERLATVARSLGLRAGRDFGDSPHVEWRGPLAKERA
jgi:peptidoglycan L-alanyl-D-glutamate endopeptidase CwlK